MATRVDASERHASTRDGSRHGLASVILVIMDASRESAGATGPMLLLLALSLALLVLVGIGFARPATEAAGPHAEFGSMQHSVEGVSATPVVVGLGYAAGLMVIAIMGACVSIGVASRRWRRVRRWLLGWFVAYGLVFTGLVWSYGRYREDPLLPFVGGFPPPTAWLVYGVWLFPWLVVLGFVWQFDRWYFTSADERRFERILQTRRARTKPTAS